MPIPQICFAILQFTRRDMHGRTEFANGQVEGILAMTITACPQLLLTIPTMMMTIIRILLEAMETIFPRQYINSGTEQSRNGPVRYQTEVRSKTMMIMTSNHGAQLSTF